MAASHIGQKMERTGPISDGAAQHWKFAGRRDRALLDRGIATSTLDDCGSGLFPCWLVAKFIDQGEEIWMNHVAVVEIGVVLRPVAVGAISEIPRLVFLKRNVDARAVPGRSKAPGAELR